MGDIISEKLAESVTISQSLDQSFPTRLLTEGSGDVLDEPELRRQFAEIDEKRRKLTAAGLLDEERGVPLPKKKMGSVEKNVISLYLDDTRKKLSVFDEVQKKIEAFMDIINRKISTTKKLEVDRRRGFSYAHPL